MMSTPVTATAPITPAATPVAGTPAPVTPSNGSPVGGPGSLPPVAAPGTGGAAGKTTTGGTPSLGDMLRQQQALEAQQAAAAAPVTPTPGATPAPGTPPAAPVAPATPPAAATPPAEWQTKYDALEQQLNQSRREQAELVNWARNVQQQILGSQPATPPAAQPAAPQRTATGVPDFDQRLMAFITTDPTTGEPKAAPGAPPDLLVRYAEYQNGVRDFYRNFATKGLGLFEDELTKKAEAIAERKIQEYIAVTQAQQTGQQIREQNSKWMYESGPDGRIKTNWQGTPVLTPQGERFMAIQEYLQNTGMSPTEIPRAAQVMMLGDMYQQQVSRTTANGQQVQPLPAQPVAPVPPAPVDPRQAFLDQAANNAAATPHAPAPIAPAPVFNGMPKLGSFIKQYAPQFGVNLN